MKSVICTPLIVAAMACSIALCADENVELAPDVIYGHKDGLAMTLDVYRPKDANGAGILFMMSGGWKSRWSPPLAAGFKPFTDAGFTVFAVRHGSSPRYVIPEVVDDVRRSVRFVRLNAKRFGVDPQRLGVTGASSGGHLSLMLGTAGDDGDPKAADPVLRTSDRVAAVVAYCPPTDVRPWTQPSSTYYQNYPALRFDPATAGDYSPRLLASADDAATLLIHGDADKLVPIEHSQAILAELKKQKIDAQLLVLKGAEHAFKGDQARQAADARVAWFVKKLVQR